MIKTPIKTWLLAFRPKTLPAAVAPVLIGTIMAFGDGVHHLFTALLCLLSALAIQIGTNLANDYHDFKKGADTPDRIGPTRVTQSGMIKPETVKWAYIISFACAVIFGLYLIKRGGWPITLIGISAILSGILYTAGPKPLGYIGLGDAFVLIFFGPVAVAGTYYVQSFEMNLAVILAGFAPGLISVAILTVNNLRDIENDKRSGKNTLAVRFGRSFAIGEYLFSLIMAGLIPVLIYLLIQDHIAILMCTFILPFSIPTVITVCTSSDGEVLNKALEHTGKLLMIYSIIFSVGWVI